MTRPEILSEVFGADLAARGRAYHEGPYTAFLVSIALLAAFYFFFFRAGLRDRWAGAIAARFGPGVLAAVIFVILLRVSLAAVAFPLRAYSGWWNERAFGLGRLSFGAWTVEWLKSLAIATTTLALGALVLAFLLRHAGRAWWLAAWAGLSLGSMAIVLAAPHIVTPLFHRLTPLRDGATRASIVALAERAGLRAGEVLVADESRRSSHVNALVEGLGPTKRIVLYDTLLGDTPRNEVDLVVAHELGHQARRHIVKGLALGILAGGIVLFAASRLLASPAVLGWLGARSATDLRLVPVLLLVYQFGMLAELPIENAISRRLESEADVVSLELTGDVPGFVALESRLARENLADVSPPGFFRTLLYTHPTPVERVELAQKWDRESGAGSTLPGPPRAGGKALP